MSQPIPVRVLRHACPHCGRTHSRPGRAREHMARCWQNPEVKACKTCKHYEGWTDACGCEPGCNWGGEPHAEHCRVGVSLAGDEGAGIKPGPIVHCDRWEAEPS